MALTVREMRPCCPQKVAICILTGVILISIFLLVRVGSVSSALEIFVTVATSILLERLTAVMKRGQKLNELSAVN